MPHHESREMTLLWLLTSALLIGLFSTLHCIGMCGGIMGALTYSLSAEIRQNRLHLVQYLAAYNLGRIASYSLAGLLLGSLGEGLFTALSPDYGYRLLQIAAALLMSAIGLYLAGWFPKFALIERLGGPIWQRLEPLGRRLLPVNSPLQALFYGLIWGWLPCGLVYSALLMTLTAGGPQQGALFMLAFGIGTLPAVMGIGMVTQKVVHLTRLPRVRQVAGISLIALALIGLLFADQLHRLMPLSSKQQAIQCNDERI